MVVVMANGTNAWLALSLTGLLVACPSDGDGDGDGGTSSAETGATDAADETGSDDGTVPVASIPDIKGGMVADGTRVRLIHDGWDEADARSDSYATGWTSVLARYTRHATGALVVA